MSYFLSYERTCEELAQILMKEYGLVCNDLILPRLHLDETGLCLLDKENKSLRLDWNDAQWKQRAKGASGTDPLIRATKAGKKPHILDLTAGWGKDALLMAKVGATVTLLEKNPYMAALLAFAHQKLTDLELQSRMQVFFTDAKTYLNALSQKDFPDVIYFDPMHPQREKSAKVKKHLQVLQTLIPPNDDVLELIFIAKTKVLEQVVLKWPASLAPPLASHHAYIGKTIRYDVYLPDSN